MTWEAVFMQFPEGDQIQDIPRDWEPPPIGNPADVRSLLQTTFPAAKHEDGRSIIKGENFRLEFLYGPNSETDDSVRGVTVRCHPSHSAVSVLRSVGDRLDCRLLDLQTGEFADFEIKTESSINEFLERHRQMRRERWWALGGTTVVVTTLHGLQDVGVIPAKEYLSKTVIGAGGVIGLLFLNILIFLSALLVAMKQAQQLKAGETSQNAWDEIDEVILLPAFLGQGHPPSFIARYSHIAVGILCGMVVGSLVAGVLSLMVV